KQAVLSRVAVTDLGEDRGVAAMAPVAAHVERFPAGQELGALLRKLVHRHGKIIRHPGPPSRIGLTSCTLGSVRTVRSSTYSTVSGQSTQRGNDRSPNVNKHK